jgi:hypothetical protein
LVPVLLQYSVYLNSVYCDIISEDTAVTW